MAILLGLLVGESVVLAWSLRRPRPGSGFATAAEIAERFKDQNPVGDAYHGIDFSAIYPGHSKEDIDYLQRECGTLRYMYAPFVEYLQYPTAGRFVGVNQACFRTGPTPQPWPPDPKDYSVFVFGGSTVFGYGAFPDETVVAYLQRELAARFPALRIQCYNFGVVSYISSQERALFETLLMNGTTPRAALFIDGLNDFYNPDGMPQLTPILFQIVTPDTTLDPPAMNTVQEKTALVDGLLARYVRNLRLTESVAMAHGVKLAVIAQPTPFVDFPIGPKTYPFDHKRTGHELCRWGYGKFKALAVSGKYGPNFLWCGDAFADATSIMYADGIHYSAQGAKVLARTIADRMVAAHLIP